jgi:hypothetical protein
MALWAGEQRSSSRRGPLAKIALITGIAGRDGSHLAEFVADRQSAQLPMPACGSGGARVSGERD